MEKDWTAVKSLVPILRDLQQLQSNLDDTVMLADSEAYVGAQLLDDIKTIIKVESFQDVGGFELSLGSNYFVDNYETTIELMGLLDQWESGVREKARGDMSAEVFGQLPLEEQKLKMGLATLLSGSSPLSMIENMLRDKKPDEVEKRTNDVVRTGC